MSVTNTGKAKVIGALSMNLPESVDSDQSEGQAARELSALTGERVDVVRTETGDFQVLREMRD